jgi:hemolysin activation/secretion protein
VFFNNGLTKTAQLRRQIMETIKKALGIGVVLLIVSVIFVNDASAKFLFFGPSREQMTEEEKIQQEEAIQAQKEAAEREKREAAEQARAKKEERVRLKQLNAEAKMQAREEIAQAKAEMNEKLVNIKQKEKEQAASIKQEKAGLKSGLNQEKAQTKAEYKQALAGASAEEKEFLNAEYKDKLAKLDLKYNQDMAALKEREQNEKAQNAVDRDQIEQDYKQQVARINMAMKRKIEDAYIETLPLLVDTTTRYTAKDLQISGNTLITTAELLEDMPLVYNASPLPLTEAQSIFLFDLRPVHDVIIEPGQPHEVSVRTIQGLTQYLLSIYQNQNYGGIYIYVPQDTIVENNLKDEVLHVEVIEAPISSITVNAYEPNQTRAEEGYLKSSTILKWSPVKVGEVANQKALNEFVNLLNLNPDRYVSAVVSKGVTPTSLSVNYDIYEANPWHWFIQVDNAGTDDRQWNPRVGLINTNLLGFDDTFTAVYQTSWDKEVDEKYSIYGSYDFPLLIPRVRLNIYAGYSQYNTQTSGITDFIGNGHFVGGILRYNALQHQGWFFDVKGMIEHTRSKVSPTVFPLSLLESDVQFTMWGVGPELHRSDDMRQSAVGYTQWKSIGGGSNSDEFKESRTDAESLFTIYDFYANHSQFIDPNKVTRFSGTFRWIGSDERLVPAKMTSFGGLYSVRGYDEYEIVADGGILASFQYEYDIIKHLQTKEGVQLEDTQTGEKPLIRRLAPLAFFDYGRTTIRHPQPGLGEVRHEELMSVGGGCILELGDNFSGAVYYGYPLKETDDTRTGKGRVNTSLLIRW